MPEQEKTFNTTDIRETQSADITNRRGSGKKQGEQAKKFAEHSAETRRANNIPSDSQLYKKILNDLQAKNEQLLASASQKGVDLPALQRSMREGVIVYMYHGDNSSNRTTQQEIQEIEAWSKWLTDPNAQGQWVKSLRRTYHTVNEAYTHTLQSGCLEECNQERRQHEQLIDVKTTNQTLDIPSSHDTELGLSSEEIKLRNRIFDNISINNSIIDSYEIFANNRVALRENKNSRRHVETRNQIVNLKDIISKDKDIICDRDKDEAISAFWRIYMNDEIKGANAAKVKKNLCSIIEDIKKEEWEHLGKKIQERLTKVKNPSTVSNWEHILLHRTHDEMDTSEQSHPKGSESSTWFTASDGNDSMFDHLSKAIDSNPGNAKSYRDQMLSHIDDFVTHQPRDMHRYYSKAFECLHKNIEDNDPSDTDRYFKKGVKYMNTATKNDSVNKKFYRDEFFKLTDKAIEHHKSYTYQYVKEALKCMYEDIESNSGYMQLYLTKAINYIYKSIEYNKGNDSFYCNVLFDYLNKAKKPNQYNAKIYCDIAVKYTDTAVTSDPHNKSFYWNKLLEYLKGASKSDPGNSILYHNLGLKCIETASKSDPGNSILYQNKRHDYIPQVPGGGGHAI
jgi:hypothetical protein